MDRNRRIQPRSSLDDIKEFPHEEDIEYLPNEISDLPAKTLYLNLSAIFGVQPLYGRLWPTICLILVTATNVVVIWLNVNAFRADWKAHGKKLMSDLLCLFGMTNANACMLLYYFTAGKNVQVLAVILGQIDQKLRWPNAFVIFEGVCFAVGGTDHWKDSSTITVITEEVSAVYNFIVVLILAQYGAILNNFSNEISALRDHLEMTGSSQMLESLEKYFHVRKMIAHTNGIYSSQMVFVVAKVFLKSVVMGYFLITQSEDLIRVFSTVVPEAAMLIFITMNCYKTQSAVRDFSLHDNSK